MTSAPFTVCILGLIAVLAYPGRGLGERPAAQSDSAKDRAKWRLTTLSAAREILDELSHPTPFSPEERAIFIEKLNTAMREDLQAHASRAASQRLCAELALRLRRETLERRFREVIARANEQSPIPVHWTEVAAQLGSGWSNTLQQTLQAFVKNEQMSLFTDARARAVGLRRQELEQQLRFPTESELNLMLAEILGGHPGNLRLTEEDEKRLQPKLLALANPDNKPSFEELKLAMNDPIRRISGEIRRQYENQRICLEKAATTRVPADRRQAASISMALLNLVESDLAKDQTRSDTSGKPVPLYPLLSPIREQVPRTAAKLESDRLGDFLAKCPALAIPADTLAKAIRSEPEKHHTPATSEALFITMLSPTLRGKTIETYAAGANPAGQREYFTSLLITNSTLSTAFESRIQSEIRTRMPEARLTISNEQYQKFFRDLDQQTPLSDEALTRLQDSGGAPLTSLDESLKLFGLSMRDSDALLEETVSRVLSLANLKAKEGYDVLITQLMLVRKLEQDRLATLREDVVARRPYKDIRAEWQTALESAWRSDSRSQTTAYKGLLEWTLASLNKTIRQLYDSLQANPNATPASPPSTATPNSETEKGKIKELQQNPAKPEDQSPESPKEIKPPSPKESPKAGGSEGAANAVLSRSRVDRRNEPDAVLLLSGVASGPIMAHLLDQTGTTTCSVAFDPGNSQSAADIIFEAMQPNLKATWSNVIREWQNEHSGFGILKRRTPPRLKLFIVIESEDVRHRMSLFLRQRIEEALTDWNKGASNGAPDAELDWKVGLTFEPRIN